MKNVAKLQSENALFKDQIASQKHYIQQLEDHIKSLRHQHFGASSEKAASNQLGLFNEADKPR